MFQRILVPTDGSPISEASAQAAIAFARGCGSQLVALAVASPEPVTLSAEGVPPEIVDAARRTRCDLIFMGSHGRRGLSRVLAGSVTQRVLADAPVPVMVYRPPAARERFRAALRSAHAASQA